MSIRVRATLLVVPILAAAVFVSANLSLLSTRRIITRTAMRSLAYKAEELEGYARSQWEILAANGLSGDPVFDAVAMRAVTEHAAAMIRTTTERIFALDRGGTLVMDTAADTPMPTGGGLARSAAAGDRGWVEFAAAGRARVGHAFPFEPFGWYIVVSDDREAFFGEPLRATTRTLVLAAVVVAVGGIAALYFTRALTRPLARMAGVIKAIGDTGDLTQAVRPEYNDEVGQLAVEFTRMLGRLSTAAEEIRQTAQRETEARLEVSSRELETLAVLGRATDYRDPETGAHIVRVGLLAQLLAGRIGVGAEAQALLRHAAPLHDIGKLGIPDSILLRPGPLDEGETRLMRRHTTMAWDILRGSRSKYLLAGAEIARTHHERWNGSGYPDGLAGEAIPLFGRIVGLVDVFDSLVSVRPYKRPWSREEAFDHLRDHAGVDFEARIVDAFLSERQQVEKILDAYPD